VADSIRRHRDVPDACVAVFSVRLVFGHLRAIAEDITTASRTSV